MPLLHLPVVHKFGIISHSRRLELQERLLQAALQDGKSKDGFQSKKNPFEVTDEFIKKYNSAQSATEKGACEAEAQRLLARVKRRTGLRDGGVGQHVNLPFAWTELVFLAHCRGRVHQDALDTLLISLHQAPVGYYQVPALFYIAETVLYWLQSESPNSDALRSAEVKSLKIGQVTLLRLFYHHMTGQLRRHSDSRTRLALYLREFPQLEQLYASYPDVAFCHSFITAAGKVVAAETEAEAEQSATSKGEEAAPIDDGDGEVSAELRSLVTAEVHDLSPVLWHALDVWRCARHLGGDLGAALDGLAGCAISMGDGNWIDTYLALLIVANAACENAECLRLFLELGVDRELFVNDKERLDSETAENRRRESKTTTTENNFLASKQTTNVTMETSEHEQQGNSSSGESVTTTTFPVLSYHDNKEDDESSDAVEAERWRGAPDPDSTEPGCHAVGIATWRWELAVGYAQQLTRVCIDGSGSSVRQLALTYPRCSLTALALRRIDTDEGAADDVDCWRIRYLALQGLMVVAKTTDGNDLKKCLRDAAWPTIEQCQRRERVPFVLDGQPLAAVWADLDRLAGRTRPGAMSGLVGHLAYALTLVYLPALPPPVRLQKSTPASVKATARERQSKPAPTAVRHHQSQQRTSLRQEIELSAANSKPAVDFAARRGFDLRRVVEDQWRKQAQSQLELDNATREEKLRAN